MCQLLAYDWCTDNSTTDIGPIISCVVKLGKPYLGNKQNANVIISLKIRFKEEQIFHQIYQSDKFTLRKAHFRRKTAIRIIICETDRVEFSTYIHSQIQQNQTQMWQKFRHVGITSYHFYVVSRTLWKFFFELWTCEKYVESFEVSVGIVHALAMDTDISIVLFSQ